MSAHKHSYRLISLHEYSWGPISWVLVSIPIGVYVLMSTWLMSTHEHLC
jgi:hypothetical protein